MLAENGDHLVEVLDALCGAGINIPQVTPGTKELP
jgi:hypothetical protein